MAGKIKKMNLIKQLLIMHQQSQSIKHIARTLSMSKNTVKSYLEKVTLLLDRGIKLAELLDLEEPELEARLHVGNPAYKDDFRYQTFMSKMEYFIQQLKSKGVNKYLLWEEYKAEVDFGYGYSQFCWHIQQYQKASKPSAVLTHLPADKLFIDFAGKTLSYIDIETGEIIPCQVFVACLPYSDYCFVKAVHGQTTEDFIYALRCCLEDLGGVAKCLVPDNLKAAIIKASRYDPDINEVLLDFANHYCTTVLPARVAKPKDKALVENQVKIIYTRVYAKLRNMQFFDLESLNKAIKEKVCIHNQTRMQKKPWSREEKFLAEEKHLLTPLPVEPFEIKHYKVLKVAKNNHIYLSENKNYYSVPYLLIGQKVKVAYTRNRVHIYHKGVQVAVHLRSYRMSHYTTDLEHLCSQHQHYFDRSPEYYLERAGKTSETLKLLVEHIFKQNRPPEQLYKTCDGLLNLARHTPSEALQQACEIALEHQVYTYGFLKNILSNGTNKATESMSEKTLPKHHNLRGKHYYQQQINFNTNESN